MTHSARGAPLRDALEQVQGVFAEAERVRDSWDVPTGQLPTTAIAYAEALHIVQRREDEKRRRESRHEAKNKKKGAQEQAHLPGSRPGFDPEVSAFWMVMEDYCRAVQPSDISLLLPLSKGFEDDVAFHVPALGCAATGHADEAHKAIEAALEHAAAPSLRADLEEGRRRSRAADTVGDTRSQAPHEAENGLAASAALASVAQDGARPGRGLPGDGDAHTGKLLEGLSRGQLHTVLHALQQLFPEEEGAASWHALLSRLDKGPPDKAFIEDAAAALRGLVLGAQVQADNAENGDRQPEAGADLSLNGFMHLLTPIAKTLPSAHKASECVGAGGDVKSAADARALVDTLLQGFASEASERLSPQLPGLDANGNALPPRDPVAAATRVVAKPRAPPPIPLDEFVHPYFCAYLDSATVEGPGADAHAALLGRPRPAATPPAPSPRDDATDGAPPSPRPARKREGATHERADAPVFSTSRNQDRAARSSARARPDTDTPAVSSHGAAQSHDGDADTAAARGERSPPAMHAHDDGAPAATRSSRGLRDDGRAGSRKRGASNVSSVAAAAAARRAGGGESTPSASRKRGRSREPNGDADGDAEQASRTVERADSVRSGTAAAGRGGKGRASGVEPRRKASRGRAGADATAESSRASEASEDVAPAGSHSRGGRKSGARGGKGGRDAAASSAARGAAVADAAAGAANADSRPAGGAPAAGDAAVVSTEVEQWALLQGHQALLAIAPEDEVLAELLSLQAELAQVTVTNRVRSARLLAAVLPSLPEQQAAERKREQQSKDITEFILRTRAAKREAKQARRVAERASALAALHDRGDGGGAKAAARHRRGAAAAAASADDDETDDDEDDAELPLTGDALVDPWSIEGDDPSAALCAVCGDGSSYDGNPVMFCDRCNVPVHQACYAVDNVPEGEWLCWPCVLHERKLKAAGKARDEIRKPRYMLAGGKAPEYDGGAKSAECALCPIKCGLLKQTVGPRPVWVHTVCALWQGPEVTVLPADRPDAIRGLEAIRAERRNSRCAYCRLPVGATVKCAHAKCHIAFHPLCARRAGCFAVCRHAATRGRSTYKTWCRAHSDAARRRERDAPPSGRAHKAVGSDRGGGGSDASLAADPAIVSEVRQLSAVLAAHERAHDFLRSVRLDLESARIICAQVERREREKAEMLRRARQQYEVALQHPEEAAPLYPHLGIGPWKRLLQQTMMGQRVGQHAAAAGRPGVGPRGETRAAAASAPAQRAAAPWSAPQYARGQFMAPPQHQHMLRQPDMGLLVDEAVTAGAAERPAGRALSASGALSAAFDARAAAPSAQHHQQQQQAAALRERATSWGDDPLMSIQLGDPGGHHATLQHRSAAAPAFAHAMQPLQPPGALDPRPHLTPAQAHAYNERLHGLHTEGFAYMPAAQGGGAGLQGLQGPAVGGAAQPARTSTRPRRAAAAAARRMYDDGDDFEYGD